MADWTSAALHLLAQDLVEDEVITRLVASGCPPDRAEKLVAFLPLACGRILLADMGITFSPTFRAVDRDGRVGAPQKLSADPEWKLAQSLIDTAKAERLAAHRTAGVRSAEFDAVNKALLNGSKPADLVGSDPIFLLSETSIVRDATKRPWWAFWRRLDARRRTS